MLLERIFSKASGEEMARLALKPRWILTVGPYWVTN
jgi:hypothetical protein